MVNYYTALVPSTTYPTINSALSGILSSGLQTFDKGFINVNGGVYSGSGSYIIPSGTIYITATSGTIVDTMSFRSSGILNIEGLNISSLSVSGYGQLSLTNVSGTNISISGCSVVNVTSGFINNSLSVINTKGVIYNNINVVGSGQLSFNNVTNVSIYSGLYSNNTRQKMTFQLCSGIYIDRAEAANVSGNLLLFKGCPNITLNHLTFASNVSGFAMAQFEALSGVNCSGNILYSILVGNIGSGMGPLSRSNTSQNIISTTSCLYNFVPNQSYTGVSGTYFNKDPLFVNASAGDLRPDVNSPCASTADYLDFLDGFDDIVIDTQTLNKESIKFYLLNQGIKAVTPSGIYVIGDGLAVYLQADSSLDNDMDIVINKQYKVQSSGVTFQSFSNGINISGYMGDYKLIPYIDFKTNETKYYVQPFSILSFQDVLEKVGGTFQAVEVSGKFRYNGFTRDRFSNVDGIPLYWVGEDYNNYLYGYSSLSNTKIVTYPLFLASGSLSVTLPDVDYLSRVNGYGNILSNKVYVNDHYETRNIPLQNIDYLFPFKTYEKDTSSKIAALGTMGDYLTVLAREEHRDNTEAVAIKHYLHLYNKFERDPFFSSTVTFSGGRGLENVNVGDITFNDVGDLLVSVSGLINQYKFFYDYALVTRSPGILKSTLLFREQYNGVNINE